MAVLVTRPGQPGEQLVQLCHQAGIFALHLPLLNIEAGTELNQLPAALAQLNSGDYVFAVSKNAVQFAQQSLKQVGISWRKDLQYFAVGESTAADFCAQVESAVHFPVFSQNSEGLLALPQMQAMENKNILILQGNGGRELFAQQAELRGAKVQKIACYQRIPVVYEQEEQVSLCQRMGIDQILVTSAEILRVLVDFVPENQHNWLKNCRLITISERIALMAKQLGWQKVIVSAQPSNQSILYTLRSN